MKNDEAQAKDKAKLLDKWEVCMLTDGQIDGPGHGGEVEDSQQDSYKCAFVCAPRPPPRGLFSRMSRGRFEALKKKIAKVSRLLHYLLLDPHPHPAPPTITR